MLHGRWFLQDLAVLCGRGHQCFNGECVQEGLLACKLFIWQIIKINSLTHLQVGTEAKVVMRMLFQQAP